jgi:glycosyltransferase involved in cell wall biosynthesis
LDAFDLLWTQGADANLVFVGKVGWNVEKLVARMACHPENTRRFLHLDDVSDEYLKKVYSACSAVIMASECEGFGLAIVEGARHNKPLILRDIPIFKEIAGECATYFHGAAPQDLAETLRMWIAGYKNGHALKPRKIIPLTWKESAVTLLSLLPLEKTGAAV